MTPAVSTFQQYEFWRYNRRTNAYELVFDFEFVYEEDMVELEDYGEIWLYFSGQIYRTNRTQFRFSVSAEKPTMLVKIPDTTIEELGSLFVDICHDHKSEKQIICIGGQHFEILGELSLQIVTLNQNKQIRKLSGFSANLIPVTSTETESATSIGDTNPTSIQEPGPIFVQEQSFFLGIEDNGHFARTVDEYSNKTKSTNEDQNEEKHVRFRTPNQFLERFLQQLYRHLPHAKVIETNCNQVTVKLGNTSVHHINLENMWRRHPSGHPQLDLDILRCVRQLAAMNNSPVQITQRSLDKAYISIHTVEQITEMAKALLLAKQPHQPSSSILARPLAANLQISYVFDYQDKQELIVENDLKSFELTETELFRIAIQNCYKRIKRIVCRETDTRNLYQLWVDDGFDSTLLLMRETWNQIDRLIEGDCVVSLPNRNLLLVTGSNNPTALRRMQEYGRTYKHRDLPVSATQLVWSQGHWTEFNLERSPLEQIYRSKQKHHC